MNLKPLTAAFLSAAIALGSMGSVPITNADTTDEEVTTYTVTYNLDYEGIYDSERDEDLSSIFVTAELAAGEYVDIPDVNVFADGLTSSGWTYDGVYMYEPGGFFKMPDHDIVLEPVWVDKNADLYTVSYDIDNDDYEILNEENFASKLYLPGKPVTVAKGSVSRNGYTQIGWIYDGNIFTISDKLVMPDHDVVFEPCWYKNYNVYYEAGDVDRINGTKTFVYDRYETNTFDLPTKDKISRNGFQIVGWLCDYDGKIYSPVSQFTMPSADVHFTAVWEPKTYTVVFRSKSDTSEIIKIAGETDTAITVPEVTSTKKGYEFVGWSYDGVIYQPGDDFVIPGAKPGVGIALDGVWEEEGTHQDSLTLAQARQKYIDGEISEEELLNLSDFVLGQ